MLLTSVIIRDLIANRPTAGIVGRQFFASDTGINYRDNGSSWDTTGGSIPLTTKGDVFTYSTVNARLGVGSNGQRLRADSRQTTGLNWVNDPVMIPCSVVGKPGAAAIVLIFTATQAINFPANFGGSYGSLGANPTATASYNVLKNGTSIGGVSISTSGVFTFTTAGGATQALAAGDRLTVTAPSSVDATLSDCGFTLQGSR